MRRKAYFGSQSEGPQFFLSKKVKLSVRLFLTLLCRGRAEQVKADAASL